MKRKSIGISPAGVRRGVLLGVALLAWTASDSGANDPLGGGIPGLQEESPSPIRTAESELDRLLFEAEANNPGLMASYHRWQAALEKVPQASALMDPRLTFVEYLHRNVETRTGAQDFQLGIMQMFPYPGKRSLRGRSAEEEARALEQELIKNRLEVRREVKDAYYEYYFLERSIRITSENLELLRHFERVANARYEVNRTGSQDVIKAQVELGEQENDLRALEDYRLPVRARLNAALNRPTESPFPPPVEIDLREVDLQAGPILEAAFRTNPGLRAIDAEIRKQQADVEIARKEYFPDFNFGLNWINTNGRVDAANVPGDGDDVLMGSVQVNLPIYRGRLAAGVRQAEHGVREQQHRKTEAENRIAMEVQTALYRLRNAKRQIDLYSGSLIPKARQSVVVTQTAYSAEEAGFLDLVDAERVLLNFQNSYHRSIADYGQALAEIEALVGRSVVDGDSPPLAIPEIGSIHLDAPAAPNRPESLSPGEETSLGR